MTTQQYIDNLNQRFKLGNGRKLKFDEILHYQKIIVALTETDKLMKEVDKGGVTEN